MVKLGDEQVLKTQRRNELVSYSTIAMVLGMITHGNDRP
jgi:hypothetical protein